MISDQIVTTTFAALLQVASVYMSQNMNHTPQWLLDCRSLDIVFDAESADESCLSKVTRLAHNARFLYKSDHDSISINCRGERITHNGQLLVAFSNGPFVSQASSPCCVLHHKPHNNTS